MAVEVGSIVEGKVTGVKKFGAFVLLPDGKTGMVHISEVSNEYVQELSDVLSEGKGKSDERVGRRQDRPFHQAHPAQAQAHPGRPGPRVAAAPERTSAEHVV